MQVRRQWCGIFKVLKKEKNCQPRNTLQILRKINVFSDQKKTIWGEITKTYSNGKINEVLQGKRLCL